MAEVQGQGHVQVVVVVFLVWLLNVKNVYMRCVASERSVTVSHTWAQRQSWIHLRLSQ